jgi:hypothetical protein
MPERGQAEAGRPGGGRYGWDGRAGAQRGWAVGLTGSGGQTSGSPGGGRRAGATGRSEGAGRSDPKGLGWAEGSGGGR